MAVGAFADAIIRGFFGYHPEPIWPSNFTQAALGAMFLRPDAPRGFTGHLRNLKTPFGLVTVSSGPDGLKATLQS